MEKEKNESGSHDKFLDRKSDLVASSAPFPSAPGMHQPRAENTRRGISADLEQDSELGTPCFSDENSDIKIESGLHGHIKLSSTGGTSPTRGSDVNDADFTPSTDDEADYYVEQAPQAIRGSGDPLYAYNEQDFMGFPRTQLSDALRAPSPADIASRRNRRPPPLAIHGARSYSAGVPKTAIDTGRRANQMRRVASATGSMRISKPIGGPRSPFKMSPSPILAGSKGSNAPPTPDTPVLASQPADSSMGNMDNNNVLSGAELSMRDPTLTTPPTTPGGIPNFLSLNSVYNMPMVGDNFVGSSVPSYPGNYSATNMPMGYSQQVPTSTSCVSQPQTPSFLSPINSNCFGVSNRNTEYTWPESMNSRNVSPNGQQQDHYLHVPASGFALDR